MGRSRDLRLNYTHDDSGLLFEDGTRYTIEEAMYLAQRGVRGADLRAVHLVKNVFDGDIECGKPLPCVRQAIRRTVAANIPVGRVNGLEIAAKSKKKIADCPCEQLDLFGEYTDAGKNDNLHSRKRNPR